MSTYDVARGYEVALRALGQDVQAFNYHGSLAFYQMALDYWREDHPRFWPDTNAHLVLASERVIFDVLDFVPDVVLIVCGMSLHRRAYELIHRLNVPMVLLLTESPYEDQDQAVIMHKGHVSAAFTNDLRSVETLREMSGVHTVYLPHAYDPEVHHPGTVGSQWHSDVFFHGTMFPERQELFSGLDREGVVIDGPDPSIKAQDWDEVDEMMEKILPNAELAQYYRGTSIALNYHRRVIGVNDEGLQYIGNGAAYSIGPRAYEIAACGAFQLCDATRPELGEVFGDSVATFTDRDDLVDKIEYYLRHPDERARMAQEALERVQDCTFEARAREIIIPALTEVLENGSTKTRV
jgi:spore maturation protein CgeB